METPSREATSPVKKKIPLWILITVIVVVTCVVFAALILTGRINLLQPAASVAGTYVNEFNSNEFITLKEDGTFLAKEKGINFYGKWKIEGNTITLYAEKMVSGGVEIPLGITEKATLQGNAIIDEDGIRWVKQTSLTMDFSINADPASMVIQQGEVYTSIITITSIYAFSQPVQLSVSGAPEGVAISLNPSQVTPPLGSSSTSVLTISVGKATTPGNYSLVVTGTSGSLTRSTNIHLTVTLSPVEWQKTYGGIYDDYAHCIQKTSDGRYIIAGVKSNDSGNKDGWLFKIDESGNMLWQKTYGGRGWDHFEYVQQTSDGGYIIAGWTNSSGAGRFDFWLIKTDNSGNLLWQKTYGGIYDDNAQCVQETLDGGYIVVGETESFGLGNGDAWIIKTDSFGNIEWQKTYGGYGWDSANYILQTDGGYIMAGQTHSIGIGGDAWIIRIDNLGNIVWQRNYGGSNWDRAFSVIRTVESGYVVAGDTRSFGDSTGDGWLFKVDDSGNMLWQKTYGKPYYWDFINFVQPTVDGRYILVGFTESGNYDFLIVKTDSFGNIEWQKTYGGANEDRAYFGQQTSDGGFVIIGYTNSFPNRDVLLVKFRP